MKDIPQKGATGKARQNGHKPFIDKSGRDAFVSKEGTELTPFIQRMAEPTVTPGNSPEEDEANQIAEKVARMPIMTMPEKGSIQRKCTECEKSAFAKATADKEEKLNRQESDENEIEEKPLAEQISPIQRRQPEGAPPESPEGTPAEEEEEITTKVQRKEEASNPTEAPIEEKEPETERINRKTEDEEEITNQLQRKEMGSAPPGTEERKEEQPIFAKAENAPSKAGPQVTSKLQASKGSGSPLPKPTRAAMETAFGADFGGVRIHTGPDAVQMNKDLHAQAFTHGKDVYFNEGKFQPEQAEGKRLLAHELVHVGQSKRSNISSLDNNNSISKKDPTETTSSSSSAPKFPSKIEAMGYTRDIIEEKLQTFFQFHGKEYKRILEAAIQNQLINKDAFIDYLLKAALKITSPEIITLTEEERMERLISKAIELALHDRLKELVRNKALLIMRDFFENVKKSRVIVKPEGVGDRIPVVSANLRKMAMTITELKESKEELEDLFKGNEDLRREIRRAGNVSHGIYRLEDSFEVFEELIDSYLESDLRSDFKVNLLQAKANFEKPNGPRTLVQFLNKSSHQLDVIRKEQIEAVSLILSKIYMKYPLFAELDPEDVITGTYESHDEKLYDAANKAYNKLLSNIIEVIRYIESDRIHPFELPVAIQEAKGELPGNLQSELEKAVSAHEEEKFWEGLDTTLIIMLLPVLGPVGVAVSFGVSVLEASDRLVDVFRKSVISDLVPEGGKDLLLYQRATFWDQFFIEIGTQLASLGGGAVLSKLSGGKAALGKVAKSTIQKARKGRAVGKSVEGKKSTGFSLMKYLKSERGAVEAPWWSMNDYPPIPGKGRVLHPEKNVLVPKKFVDPVSKTKLRKLNLKKGTEKLNKLGLKRLPSERGGWVFVDKWEKVRVRWDKGDPNHWHKFAEFNIKGRGKVDLSLKDNGYVEFEKTLKALHIKSGPGSGSKKP